MSYCVNCGVELNDSEKRCPLCGTSVVNPLKAESAPHENRYAFRVEKLDAVDRKFWVRIVSVILAVPVAILLVLNLLYDGAITWSLYAVGGIAVLWAFGVSPFLFSRPTAVKWIVIDTAALSGYLYLIEYLSGGDWFFPVAFPIVLTVGLFVLLLAVFFERQVLKGLYTVSAVALAAGLLLVEVEALVDFYSDSAIHIVWSWFVLISCAAVALTFVLIERKKKVKEELRKRLHI